MSLSSITPLPDQEDVIETLVDPLNEELNYNEDFGGEYVDNAGDDFQQQNDTLVDYDPDNQYDNQYDNQDINDDDDADDIDNPVDFDDPDNPDNQSVAVYDHVFNPQEAQNFINRLSKPLQSSSKPPSTIPINSPTSYVLPSSPSSSQPSSLSPSFQPKVSALKVPTSPVQQSSMQIITNLPSVSNPKKPSSASKKN